MADSPSGTTLSANDLQISPTKEVDPNTSKDEAPFSPLSSPGESESPVVETACVAESIANLRSTDEERWRCLQQATFANWVNERLKAGGVKSAVKVTDLTVDLQDGIVLIRLMEGLTGTKIKGFNKTPKLTAHKMDNLDLVFSFMQSSGVKVVGIGSHNVYKGDINLILGLIWTLIQKYQLQMEGTPVSTTAVMLAWLRALLPTWNISNLTTDWNDGRALIALINEVMPGVAPNVTTLNPTKRRINCSLAIDIAFNHLKIPKLISADNLSSSSIDELSIITYLSYFRDPARARLLKWCKRMLPQFQISNFSTDWKDELALAALLSRLFPGCLREPASLERENALETVQAVVDAITRKLGITVNFQAENLAKGEVDELQVMTLVMQMRDGKLQPLPEEVVVSGPGIIQAVLGKDNRVTIDTTYAGPGELDVQVKNQDEEKIDFTVKKQGKVATVTYCALYPGDITIDILWSDRHVPNSPFTAIALDALKVKIDNFDGHKRVVYTNEPIELNVNTENAGQGNLTAHLTYEGDLSFPVEVEALSCSLSKLRYIPTKAGQPTLHIFWNEEELSHLLTTYTVMDRETYVVSEPEFQIYNVHEDINFRVVTKGGKLSALQMSATLEGSDVQVPVHFEEIESGVGHATFQPTLPGVYHVEVACVDQLVEGSPFQVNVATVDASQCKIVEEIPNYIQLRIPYTINVDTRNAGKGELSFECEEDKDGGAAFLASVSPPDSNGISKIKITPLFEGKKLITLKFDGTEIPGSPFPLFVCDPSRCTVSNEILENNAGIVGKPIQFNITVDPIDDLKPVIKVRGPIVQYTIEVDEIDKNFYTVQFVPWEIGPHEIFITYGDLHIPNSPFLITVTTFNSTTCSATGSGLQKASAGVPAQFVIVANQAGLLKNGTLNIQVQGVLNRVNCKVRARDNKNGTYDVAYLVNDPGDYLISIRAEDRPIPGSPFQLTALPRPNPEKCHMYGPVLQSDAILTIGSPMEFTVDCSEGGEGELSVKAVGPGGLHALVYITKDDEKGNGIHNIKLDPVRHGKYRVSVRWSGQHITGSPFMLCIYPRADASKCKAYGPGLKDGLIGDPGTFTIETKDAGAGTLKVCLLGVKGAFKIEVKPVDQQDNRTLEAQYNPTEPGLYLVSIMWSDQHIPGSPFRVKIDKDELDSLKEDTTEEKGRLCDESLTPIAEEREWEEGVGTRGKSPIATVSDMDPIPPKRKKRMKKWNKSSTDKI